MRSEERLLELCTETGIRDIPLSWQTHWEAFRNRCCRFPLEPQSRAAAVFQLPDEMLEELGQAFERVSSNRDLGELAQLWHHLIFHTDDEKLGDNPDVWPLPERGMGSLSRMFPVVVMLTGTDHALDAYRSLGGSVEIAYATLSVGGFYVRDFYRRNGVWGLAYLGWMRNHLKAKLFRLGRLTFKDVMYDWPYRVLRNKRSGQIVTLCEPGRRYRRDGLADGTNGIHDPQAWEPLLLSDGKTMLGHAVTEEGRVNLQSVSLEEQEWEKVLSSGDRMLEVHVPSAEEAGKLRIEDCTDAYRMAVGFFGKLYSKRSYSAFTCWSWLLDPNLAILLSPDSNIVKFQRMYHLLPVPGDEKQLYDIVFHVESIDPTTAPRITELQRTIANYVADGHQMRSSAGFIPWEEITK